MVIDNLIKGVISVERFLTTLYDFSKMEVFRLSFTFNTFHFPAICLFKSPK